METKLPVRNSLKTGQKLTITNSVQRISYKRAAYFTPIYNREGIQITFHKCRMIPSRKKAELMTDYGAYSTMTSDVEFNFGFTELG